MLSVNRANKENIYHHELFSMHVEKLSIKKKEATVTHDSRPSSFSEFIGQQHITTIIQTAIASAKKNNHSLWHILLGWPSGYGKTTLAHIISVVYGKRFHMVTGYALSKPAEILSILNSLQEWDIVFIDEVHRLKPTIEEMMYIAMEDFAIDMVMPDWWAVRIPLKPFTLIGATTQLESLSEPFKNRFIYQFHCTDYNEIEKQQIIGRYLALYNITTDHQVIPLLSRKVDTVPRKIHNLIVNVRDFLISHHHDLTLNKDSRERCEQRLSIKDGWLTPLHQKYLSILEKHKPHAVGLKTIAAQLSMNEKSIEQDIEPILIKQNMIEKTSKGRKMV